jgi:3-dehydrosphinganine reductase
VTLRDKHVLITGGSSGIGLALALRAASAGARVSLVARDSQKLALAREAITASNPGAGVFTGTTDVAFESEVNAVFIAAEAAHGPVDVLITSAGTAHPGYFEEIPIGVFERSMAVNYLGTLYAIRAAVPGMRKRGSGAIVLVSSGAGLVGLFGYAAYSPTKFALRGLAETLRAELRPMGVSVSIVYPPDTDTPQLAEENLTKPPETRALTAGAGVWSADEVARLTREGVERGRFALAPGFHLTVLLWFQSLLAPLLAWHFDRVASRARDDSGTKTPRF